MIDFTSPPRTDADHRARRTAELLRPYETEHVLVRVGDDADGGYVMADLFTAPRAVSIGVGGNVSWDLDMARRNITVTMFDPTVDGPPTSVPGATFHAIGLGTPAQSRALSMNLAPFKRVLEMAGTQTGEAILKVDIEGAEWDALSEVSDYTQFPQVVLELHNLSRLADVKAAQTMLRVLECIHRSHMPIHVHANNEAAVVPFGCYWLPDVLEVSYLRRDLITSAEPSTVIDATLDRPSNARFADLSLNGLLTVNAIS